MSTKAIRDGQQMQILSRQGPTLRLHDSPSPVGSCLYVNVDMLLIVDFFCIEIDFFNIA